VTIATTETIEATRETERKGRDDSVVTHGLPALVLAHTEGGLRAPEVRFLPAQGVELGRGCEVFDGGVLQDGRMSRSHARIYQEDERWYVRDLGSRNGSKLNGQRLEGAAPLASNSVLRLGDTLLVFAQCHARGESDPELVGVSAAIGAIRSAIDAVARDVTTVLITGETGTGKEVVAQALHQKSGRKGRLVSVNCGAMPETLLASELFGHTKGAFTGANEARDGLFRHADGGTLFLDEMGEMPLALQVQLLRVLETRVVRPVGSTRDFPVDVRVIAATHRDLPLAIHASTFRADLYARLAQWRVQLPRLRERRADIPLLTRRLLARRGADGRAMTPDLAEALLLHSWAFNVRGLLNTLTTADIACPRGEPLALRPEIEAILATDRAMLDPFSSPAPAPLDLPEKPRATIEEALRSSRGRIAEAARQLRCSRQQLYRWIDAHGIDIQKFRIG
jgi:DNA-binding NtrC family response regulator